VTNEDATYLAAAVVGKAKRLITSFDAIPGDDLLVAVDLRGSWRNEKPFWNASSDVPPERLRADLDLLPAIAELGLCRAGKDISNGGIVGTLAMLLHCSSAGAELRLDQIPKPEGTSLARWIISFPSFGYLLCVSPEFSNRVIERFAERDIACTVSGRITADRSLSLGYGSARVPFPLAEAIDPRARFR
jgi:selenophosphate synthetase-related protein